MRTVITLLLSLLALAPAHASAGQTGGSILYEDRSATEAKLEFRAFVWHVRDGYYRTVGQYRRAGESRWQGLDRNWCWTRRCALREIIVQARYLARDGYIWRFEQPTRPPARAKRYRFSERSYRDGVRACARRLLRRR